MNDRELLELAAKAAGIDYIISGGQLWTTMDGSIHKHTERWNPLANDGQALRLAAKVMEFEPYKSRGYLPCITSDAQATRRSIVRAAAAISESK